MSVPCPVPMQPGSSGKAVAVVFAILVLLAIAASQIKPAANQPAKPNQPMP